MHHPALTQTQKPVDRNADNWMWYIDENHFNFFKIIINLGKNGCVFSVLWASIQSSRHRIQQSTPLWLWWTLLTFKPRDDEAPLELMATWKGCLCLSQKQGILTRDVMFFKNSRYDNISVSVQFLLWYLKRHKSRLLLCLCLEVIRCTSLCCFNG